MTTHHVLLGQMIHIKKKVKGNHKKCSRKSGEQVMNFQSEPMKTNHTLTMKSKTLRTKMKLIARETRVRYVLNTEYEILNNVLCHELKSKPWKSNGSCSGYPMYRVVCQENLLHWLIKFLSWITLRVFWVWVVLESGEQSVKNLMSFDVGRWNLVKATCLLLVDEVGTNDKTYLWKSVWWETKNESWGIYTARIHWVDRGTGTPKDRDEVNRREVCECDGWVCDLDVIVVPSKLRVIRKDSTLSRILPTRDLRRETNTGWWKWMNPTGFCLLWINKVRVQEKTIYEYRCDERLKTKNEKSTRLVDTGLVVKLEHLKTKTRLKDEKFEAAKKKAV